jgi:hypothetical protein
MPCRLRYKPGFGSVNFHQCSSQHHVRIHPMYPSSTGNLQTMEGGSNRSTTSLCSHEEQGQLFFKTKVKLQPTNNWKPFKMQWKNPQRDQNAMDISPGRTRARIAEAEDFLPGGNQYDQRMGGGIPRGPAQGNGSRKVLTCFFCGKPGHFARDC